MIEPGQTCSECGRKMPHPKTEHSPETKGFFYRVPLDEVEAHESTVTDTLEYLGYDTPKFGRFKIITLGCGAILQDESLRGFFG